MTVLKTYQAQITVFTSEAVRHVDSDAPDVPRFVDTILSLRDYAHSQVKKHLSV